MGFLKRLDEKFLIVLKLTFVFVNLQYYTLHQFRGVFVKEKFDVTNSQLGVYLGLFLCAIFFTNTLIGALNDKYERPNIFIAGALIATCIFLQLFYVDAYINAFSGMFWVNLFLYMMFNNGIPPLLDRAALGYLDKIPEAGAAEYGRQKMWGTFGYGLSTLIIERCVKSDQEYTFDGLRYYSLATTLISVPLVFSFFKFSGERRSSGQSLTAGFLELLRAIPFLRFLGLIFLNGITRQAFSIFYTVYLSEVLRLQPYTLPSSWPSWLQYFVNIFNSTPIGTVVMFSVISEFASLYYSPKIIRKIGPKNSFLASQVVQVLRALLYFLLNHENENVFMYCCIIELTRGLYFGLIHPASVQLASDLSPLHLKSTAQMLYQSSFSAISSIAAGWIFGAMFSKEKMSGKSVSLDEKAENFRLFFLVNVIFAVITTFLSMFNYFILDEATECNMNFERKSATQLDTKVATE